MVERRRVLGLDLGTNSIGWCLIEEDEAQNPLDLIAMGSRIFQTAVEDKTPTPKNHKRRRARLDRRRNQRRSRRKQRMRNYLISLGFIPDGIGDKSQPEVVYNRLGREQETGASDVYHLSKRALNEPLSLEALSKIWLSFAARRGFQSARKTLLGNLLDDPRAAAYQAELEKDAQEKAKDEEEESAFKEIDELKQAMASANAPTLGAYLADLGPHQRKRGRRTDRQMYKDEFAAIWAFQHQHHSELTPNVRLALYHIIFNQRPIRIGSQLRGDCSLEPDRKRAFRAWPEAQRFRYWVDLHNFAWVEPRTLKKISLKPEEKRLLAEMLERQATISWQKIRDLFDQPRYVKINLTESKTKAKGLKGNATACKIRKEIPDWDNWSPEMQDTLVTDLLTIDNKRALFSRLLDHWHLNTEQAWRLSTMEFESGYMNFSRKAIKKVLHQLQNFPTDQPWTLDKAIKAAGYAMPWEKDPGNLDWLPPHKKIPNPIVNRATSQMRAVVNAVIETYGKPEAIRIEMTRDLKLSKKQKERQNLTRKRNETLRKKAEEEYATIRLSYPELKLPETIRPVHLLKYRLFTEQKEFCIYSGRAIGMQQLFSEQTEIDHILPYSRTMDNSYMNKVVCFRSENAQKRNRTPYEWLRSDESKYEQVKQAVKHLPNPKRRRFFMDKDEDFKTFLNSQMADTRYVSREAQEYLTELGCDISVTRGHTTALLRKAWGLNSVLQPSGSDIKNREDHRHHAVDALIIALTTRSLYQKIIDEAHRVENLPNFVQELPLRRMMPQCGIPNLRQRVSKILGETIVSHATNRGLNGAFHEETGYGLRKVAGETAVVYRIPLDQSFSKSKVPKVVDPVLREQLAAFFENGGTITQETPFRFQKRQGSEAVRHVRVVAAKRYNPEAHLEILDESGLPVRFHPKGNNHHVEILRSRKSGKITTVFRTTHEVALRMNRGMSHDDYRQRYKDAIREPKNAHLPMIQRDHGPDFEFLMALHINDTVRVFKDNRWCYFRVQNLDPTGNRLVLRDHIAATLTHSSQKIRMSIKKLVEDMRMEHLEISTLGHPLE